MVTKAHILQEIKRTAEANGGKPLGGQKFERETGIKKSDWYGIYWTCLGEADREAGFAPNEFTRAYDDTYILERYAQLARELKRLPTGGALRLKTRSDPEFPGHTTFSKLGPKPELVKRLLEYCQNQEGYDDVIRMCKEYVPSRHAASTQSENLEEAIGFVYLNKVRFKGRWLYYIGRTDSLGRRENEHFRKFQSMKPIHAIPTPHPPAAEKYWHARFAAKCVHHSIFDLDKNDIAAFKKCKSM